MDFASRRPGERLGRFSFRGRPQDSPSIAVWFVLGAPPRGQPWTPALTLSHVCDGLSGQLMEGCYPFRMASMSPRAPPMQAQRGDPILPLSHPSLHTTKEVRRDIP